MRLCDVSEGEQAIPDELFDSDGELDEEHILCARCTDHDNSEVQQLQFLSQRCDAFPTTRCWVLI